MTAMAVTNKFSMCVEHCKEMHFHDLTGAYDATNNATGWDEPSVGPYSSSAYEDVFTFTFPDGTVKVLDLLDAGLPFPNTNATLTKIVLNTALGLGADTKLPSGKWTIKRVTKALLNDAITIVTITYTLEFWIICIEECCIDKLGIRMGQEKEDPKNCKTPGKWTTLWMQANNLAEGSKYLFGCNDYAGAYKNLEQLQAICAANPCGCD